MDEEKGYNYCVDVKRSGQIPAFGNWEYANDLPITQYFECVRQAGLFRYSNSSSGECADHHHHLYALPSFNKKPPHYNKTRSTLSNKGCPHVEDHKMNQVKKKTKQVGDVAEPPRKQLQYHLPKHSNNNNNKIAIRTHNKSGQLQARRTTTTTPTVVRAVDEDLYKIPQDLLHTSKRVRTYKF